MRALVLAAVELDGDAAVAATGSRPSTGRRARCAAAARCRVDEEVAEAALQAALHLPVARGVLLQRGAEVGAARVPAAQGALQVLRAQVVLELGFRERSQQRAVVVAGGEVQEGARDRGGREAAVERGVARAQVAADEDRQPLGLRDGSRHGELIIEGGAAMMRQRQAAVP